MNMRNHPQVDRGAKGGAYIHMTLPLIYLIAVADTFGSLFQSYLPVALLLRAILMVILVGHMAGMAANAHPQAQAILILSLYLLIRLVVNFILNQESRLLFVEGGATLRLLYFPLLLLYLQDQLKKNRLTSNDLLNIVLTYGWLVLFSLLLGNITGLGGSIGGRGKDIEAGKGFMIGANEVGLMLLLTTVYVGDSIGRLLHSRILGGLLQLVCYSLAGIHVFTKSSLAAAVVAWGAAYKLFVKHGPRMAFLIRISIIALVVGIIWQIQRNIDAIDAFLNGTFFSALMNEGPLTFLFRGRDSYISAIYPSMINNDVSWIFFLFGAGEYFMRQVSSVSLILDPATGTNFEMDFFDLFGAYGIFGLSGYVLVIYYLLRSGGPFSIPALTKVALVGTFIHAALAGHVLFSPQVTTLLALIILMHGNFNLKIFPSSTDTGSR